jgi:hypothetical protein
VAVLRAAIAAGKGPQALEVTRALVDKVIVNAGEHPYGPKRIDLVGHLTEMPCAGGAVLAGNDAGHILTAMAEFSVKRVEGGAAPPPGLRGGPKTVPRPDPRRAVWHASRARREARLAR